MLTPVREQGILYWQRCHCCDEIMDAMASQITSLTSFYSTHYLGTDQRKHQSSASLDFVWGIHWWPVNSPHKWPVTRTMLPFDDVIMHCEYDKEAITTLVVCGMYLAVHTLSSPSINLKPLRPICYRDVICMHVLNEILVKRFFLSIKNQRCQKRKTYHQICWILSANHSCTMLARFYG